MLTLLTIENFIPEVRAFLRDFPELNRLISGEESSNKMIEYCIRLAIDRFNTTPPLIGTFGISDFPSRFILLQLTIITLLSSVAILHARNRFQYSEGGFSADTEQQEEHYYRWINFFSAQALPQMKELKIAKNIEGGWGAGVNSEYAWIHSWYGLT